MSKRRAISVSLAKIDYNHGEPHLYMIADCPRGYKLVHMGINVLTIENKEWNKQYYTLDDLVAGNEDIVLNLPLSVLEGAGSPAIYHISLWAMDEIEGREDLKDELLLSDVHGVYRSMLDNILKSDDCSGISDDVIKEYLILHAHQQALFNNDIEVAKDMFKLLHKLPCGKHTTNINCGCYDRH